MINNLFDPIRWKYSPKSHRPSRLGRSSYLYDYWLPSGHGIHWTLTRLKTGWKATSLVSYPDYATGWAQRHCKTWEEAAVFVYQRRHFDYTGYHSLSLEQV